MGNINILSDEYFVSYANEIISKFQRIRELTEHPGTTGNYHEEILRGILRNFLPRRFSVKTGFIYSGKDKVSNQLDILIIDENAPSAYLFQDDQFVVVTPEAVAAVIEVKTTMNLGDFKESVANLRSAKRLLPSTGTNVALAFAYNSPKGSESTLSKWFKSAGVYREQSLFDGLLLFNSQKLILRYDQKFTDGRYFREFTKSDSCDDSNLGWQLSVFIAAIATACENRDIQEGKTAKVRLSKSYAQHLIQAEGGHISPHKYLAGTGKVT